MSTELDQITATIRVLVEVVAAQVGRVADGLTASVQNTDFDVRQTATVTVQANRLKALQAQIEAIDAAAIASGTALTLEAV